MFEIHFDVDNSEQKKKKYLYLNILKFIKKIFISVQLQVPTKEFR